MARLPKDGEYDWGKVLEEFLKQSLDHTGKLVSGSTNPHTGGPNANLADSSKAGLLRIAGDLRHTAANPKVAGLQGNPVASAQPQHGQVLAWNDNTGQWEPTSPTGNGSFAQALAVNSMRI
jgi:hypothetical protein